jgi:hypothetical protein
MDCPKKCFKTRKEAKKVCKKFKSLTYAYYCKTCSAWHTTSMPVERRRIERKLNEE